MTPRKTEDRINIIDQRVRCINRDLCWLTSDIKNALVNSPNLSGENYVVNLEILQDAIDSVGIGTNIFIVDYYSNLPDANLNSGIFYWVESSEGAQWLPGSLGGTYYSKGLYYSNGITWNKTDAPFQATQIEVNTGVNDTKFVTPLTLQNADQWDTKADVNHNHPISDISGLQTALDGKLTSVPSEYITELELAAELGDYVLDIDTRLSDARTPISHTHTASQITDFDTEVSNNTDVAANTLARHTHANQVILDATTASFTTALETKLNEIEDAWIYYATSWSVTPSFNSNITNGDVYNYTLDSVTRYRLVPTVYDATQDAFYENFDGIALTNLIITRG